MAFGMGGYRFWRRGCRLFLKELIEIVYRGAGDTAAGGVGGDCYWVDGDCALMSG